MAQHVMPTVFTRVQQSDAARNHRFKRINRVAPVEGEQNSASWMEQKQ